MARLKPTFGNLSHLPSPSRTLLTKEAMKDYVYFSDNTKGQTGKAVKIKISLFARFLALVDPNTHSGQATIRQIENLRMVNGASSGVYSNINSAFRFMLQLANMKVFYTVLDGGGQSGKEVFIGDIKPEFARDSKKPGLYTFNTGFRRYEWHDKTNLDAKFVYLNGSSGSLDIALKKAASRVLANKNDLAIFYIPGNVINELGVWNSQSQVWHTSPTIDRLREVMEFNRNSKVGWIAEAEGADVLFDALHRVNGAFAGHRFRLINPLTNTPALLQKLKAKEIKPASDEVAPVTYTGENRAANIFMESQKQALINALRVLRARGLAEEPHQIMVTELEGNTKLASTLDSNRKALNSTAALNQPVRNHRAKAVLPNSAALSFVTALKRV